MGREKEGREGDPRREERRKEREREREKELTNKGT